MACRLSPLVLSLAVFAPLSTVVACSDDSLGAMGDSLALGGSGSGGKTNDGAGTGSTTGDGGSTSGGSNGTGANGNGGGVKRDTEVLAIAILVLSGAGMTVDEGSDRIESLDEYFRENSNDRLGFAGQSFGVYDIPASAYTTTGNVSDLALEEWEAQGNSQHDYDYVAFVLRQGERFSDANGNDKWAGLAGGTRSWYRSTSEGTFIHEIGHNLGLQHSSSLTCSGASYLAHGEDCSRGEYGHVFDKMGNSGLGGHVSAAQKETLGWLDGCQNVKAGASGVFRLTPLEGECGIRSLKIPIAGQEEYYYVDFRENGSGKWAGTTRDQDGVTVTVSADGGRKRPNPLLLDFDLSTPGDFRDAILKVGTSYDLPGGVQLKVLEQNDSGAVVSVQMSGSWAPRCADNTIAPTDGDGHYVGDIGPRCDTGADYCPNDDGKTVPGICGCGTPENDANADGVIDCIDFRCVEGEEPDTDTDGAYSCSVHFEEEELSTQNEVPLYFSFYAPPGTREITFRLTQGNLDADLYVRRGAVPTQEEFDCRSGNIGDKEEVCVLSGEGTYEIMIVGYYGQFEGAKLTATYTDFTIDECPDDPAKVTGCGE